jgi:hypothetical protein
LSVVRLNSLSISNQLRLDVLDHGVYTGIPQTPEFSDPFEVSAFIKENIPEDAVIETWERELGILNDNLFHYPDQAMLVYTHAAIYRGASSSYSLSREYFDEAKPDYVIVGWWARFTHIYDLTYLEQNAEHLITIGSAEWGYDIYRLKS